MPVRTMETRHSGHRLRLVAIMKLIEALRILGVEGNRQKPVLRIGLVCGFTPLHFQTFLGAHIRRASGHQTEIKTGLYGDFWGNLEKLDRDLIDFAIVVMEWSDLDPRLGLRSLGSWSPSALPNILETAQSRARQFLSAIGRISEGMPVVICFPTLPLPPVSYAPSWQGNSFSLELRSLIATLSRDSAQIKNVKIMDDQRLNLQSPYGERFDPKADLLSGFPYKLPHASTVAELLSQLTHPVTPKKGLITDLDDTLWAGILGEVGLQGINWDLENKSHMHGAYQRLLHALSESGVLIAVASKNEPQLVQEALAREDLILPAQAVFPVEASWGLKSQAVGRILQTWNISADAVVFIDDSPMELAEVQNQYPEIETILFPKNDYHALNDLFYRLRDLFGKSSISEEDSIRRESIRRTHRVHPRGSAQSTEAFLEQAEATFAFDFSKNQKDNRAFELINKTNQFNLNGRRFSEFEWQRFLKEADTFLLAVTYEDKYGPLGKIAVVAGRTSGKTVLIDHWVMSCRAFSRRVEHRTLEELLRHFDAEEIIIDFELTLRNGPLREFLSDLLQTEPMPHLRIDRPKIKAFLDRSLPGIAEVARA
jgi:FkbH-like protein